MEIVVTEVVTSADGVRLFFTCDLGEGVGWWQSPTLPLRGSTQHVELSVAATLAWGETIVEVAPASQLQLALDGRGGDGVILTAVVVRWENDTLDLQLGPRATLMLTTRGGPGPAVGSWIRAHLPRLGLDDMDI